MSRQSLRSRKIIGLNNIGVDNISTGLFAKNQYLNNTTSNGIIFTNSNNRISIITENTSNNDLSSLSNNIIRIGHNVALYNIAENTTVIGNNSMISNSSTRCFVIGNNILNEINEGKNSVIIGNDIANSIRNVSTSKVGIYSIGGFNIQSNNLTAKNYSREVSIIGFNNANYSNGTTVTDINILGNYNNITDVGGVSSLNNIIGQSNTRIGSNNNSGNGIIIGNLNKTYGTANYVIGNSNNALDRQHNIIGSYFNELNTDYTGLNVTSIGFHNCKLNGANSTNILGSFNNGGNTNVIIGNNNLTVNTNANNNIIIGNDICKEGTQSNNILIGNAIETQSSNSLIINTDSTDYKDIDPRTKCVIRGPIQAKSLGIGVGKLFYDIDDTKQIFYSID